MKKNIFLLLAFLTAAIGASASIVWTTSCGVQVVTVERDAFPSEADANEFYESLDDIFCGDDEEDHGELPEDNPGNE